jgi:hypothetical protein
MVRFSFDHPNGGPQRPAPGAEQAPIHERGVGSDEAERVERWSGPRTASACEGIGAAVRRAEPLAGVYR